MKASTFNIWVVLKSTGSSLGFVMFDISKKPKSKVNWNRKGSILRDYCENFVITDSAKANFRFVNGIHKLDHFLEIRENVESESCYLDFGWLSVRCVKEDNQNNQETEQKDSCPNEKWFENGTCGETDQCNIIYSFSGTLWKQETANQAFAMALYITGMERVFRYQNEVNNVFIPFLAPGTEFNSGNSYRSIYFDEKLTSCSYAKIRLLANSGSILQELYLNCSPSSVLGWFSAGNFEDLIFGTSRDFEKGVFATICTEQDEKSGFCIQTTNSCSKGIILLRISCGSDCIFDHNGEKCEILYRTVLLKKPSQMRTISKYGQVHRCFKRFCLLNASLFSKFSLSVASMLFNSTKVETSAHVCQEVLCI